MKWQFAPQSPMYVQTEVTQRDQFKNDDVNLSDTIVREAIQNSLDAGNGDGPVRVRVRWVSQEHGLTSEFMRQLLDEQIAHAASAGLDMHDVDFEHPVALVIEDFGLRPPDRPARLLPRHRGRPHHQRRGRRVTQTIRRAARRHRFVIVDQAAVEDTRLSWAARGLLAYLLSRPDDWKVLVNDLKKRGNLGRDGIYALLRELRSAGYARFERQSDSQGRMRGGTYIVSEVPAPVLASPDAAEPDRAAPHTALPEALPNTDGDPRTTTTNRPTDTNRGTDVDRHRQALQFPEWVPHEIRTSAQHLVAELGQADAQLVIDEWAGALAAGVIQRSPLGYLKTLATRYRAGNPNNRAASGPIFRVTRE